MRWRWVFLGLIIGGLGAAGWFILQWHQENRALEVPQQDLGQGDIGLMVEHQGPKLQLLWNTGQPDIRNASEGTLTITDGGHESTLHLDRAELRSGKAYYWPQADHVTFRLETGDGAWGSLQVPAWEVQPAKPAHAEHAEAEAHEPDHAKRHHPTTAKAAALHEAARSGEPVTHTAHEKAAKTKKAKTARHADSKIPSSWKDPRSRTRD